MAEHILHSLDSCRKTHFVDIGWLLSQYKNTYRLDVIVRSLGMPGEPVEKYRTEEKKHGPKLKSSRRFICLSKMAAVVILFVASSYGIDLG